MTERLAVVVSGHADGAVSALHKVGSEAGKADTAVTRVSATLERLGGRTSRLGLGAAVLGFGAITAGVGAAGFALERFGKSSLDIGIQFQDSLNSMQAVSHATAGQMQQVAKTARDLGNDLDLPATSAADAAEAMTELAKGNLSAQQAMQAAKGTLQLAAAAQVDGATAATIQADALNAFALKATEAGHVADVLANAANAATGEIGDFAFGLQASSAVAHQFGISLDDTVTALALFANAGIKGQDAGTSLKSALLALASPSAPAATALRKLGVDAFDARGKFVGLRVISEQLADAQKRMSQEAFNAAVSTAFGSDAARAAGILASQGAKGFNQMAAAVTRSGGAAEVAQAKMKGVGGALQGLQSQVETVKIDAFQKASPHLEAFIRGLSERLPSAADKAFAATDKFVGFIAREIPHVRSIVEQFAPAVEDAIGDKLELAAHAVQVVVLPALHGLLDVAREAAPALSDVGHVVNSVLRAGFDAAAVVVSKFEHNAEGIGTVIADMAHAVSEAGRTALPILRVALDAAAHAAGAVVDTLGVLHGLLGPLAGPAGRAAVAIGLVVVSVKALKAAGSGFSSLTTSLAGLVDKVGGAATSVATLGPRIASAPTKAISAYSRLGSTVRAVGTALPILGIGVAAIGATLEHQAQQSQALEQHYESLFQALQEGGKAARQAGQELAELQRFIQQTGGIFNGKEFRDAKRATDAYQRSLSVTDRAAQDVTRTQNDLNLAIAEHGKRSPEATSAADAYRRALEHQRDVEQQAADATKTATDRLNEKIQALLSASDQDFAYRQAVLETKTAQDQYNQAIDESGPNSDRAQQAALDLEGAVRRQADAARQAAEAKLGDASAADRTRAGQEALRKEYDRLSATLAPGSPARIHIDQTRRALDEAAAKRTAQLTVQVGNAAGAARTIDQIAHDRIAQIILEIGSRVAGGAIAHHAGGGAVAAGVPVVVGDGGRPEVFIPATSGTIRSSVAGQSQDQGRQQTITVNMTSNANPFDVAREVAWQLRTAGV